MKKLLCMILALTMVLTLGVPAFAVSYTEKALPVVRDKVDTTETATVRFYEDLPHVPYMSVTDFYNRFYLAGTDMTEGMSFKRDGSVYTVTNFLGDKAVFDVDTDTVVIYDMKRFIEPAHDLLLTESGGYDPDYPFAKTRHVTDPAEATPKAFTLANYDIHLRGDDTGVYAPLPTLADIFASAGGYYVVYVGEKIYIKDVLGLIQKENAMENDPDYIPAVKADRAEDLAKFTYNELCLSLDLWHGKPGQEFIHDDLVNETLDKVLSTKYPAIKEKLLATDFLTFYTGLNELYHGLLFDGGHTGIGAVVIQLDELELSRSIMYDVMDKEYGRSYYEFNYGMDERKTQCKEAREALYNGDYYAEQGDTAIIRFDHFIVDNDGWKAFYAGTGERPLITLDDEGNETWEAIGTVLSGLERAAQNPAIKNIIIDDTCNGGGEDTALLAIEWLLTGVGYVRDRDEMTSQYNTKYQDFDMNFDGVFDDKDVSPYTGYNYGVLTSKCSFSCGNNFPWFMHEHGAMILGEQSGGGACAIRMSGVGGMDMRNSAASSIGVTDEGGSIDNGCPVDANLLGDGENPTVGFYDLAALSGLMNEYFGESLAQAA